ncbi:MAG: hypothetical protein AB1611_08980 [bacterium]
MRKTQKVINKEIEIEDKHGMLVLQYPQRDKSEEEFIADIEKGYHLGDILYSKREELYER